MEHSTEAVIALGSNLGDRAGTIRQAVRDLAAVDGVLVESVSSLYETDAVTPDGVDVRVPAYLNAVAVVRTTLDPHGLLVVMQQIETARGRVREKHWGNRTLDLDLVVFGRAMLADETLVVPHPLASVRSFVLAPWLEVQPLAELPGSGRVADLLDATGESPRLHSRWAT